MGRAGIILDSAVSIVAEDCHGLRRRIHVRIAGSSLIEVGLEVIIELIILQEKGYQRHHDCSTVPFALMELVVFNGLRVLIVDTGHDIAGATVEHNQMIHIRACGRLVLCHSAVVDGAYGAFSGAGHTVADCMNSLDHGATQSSFGTASILGGSLHLLIGQLIEGFR